MRYLIVVLLLVGRAALAQENGTETTDGPVITFEETEFNFGDIHQGDKVTHVFDFENTGNAPLVITNVQTTCGCTATNWEREPIKPGSKSTITVNFNSAHKMGRQNKVISVISNSVAPLNQVKITTNVLPPKEPNNSGK